jgi:3',5'-nucleoside bisphosphate phosphatase
MKKIDLHLHTTDSDGLYTAKQLMQIVKKQGYHTISITDHDTIEGYLKSRELAEEYKIKLLPGVEISSHYKGHDVHILAYCFDVQHKELIDLLDFIHRGRTARAEKMLANLNKLGIHISMDDLIKLSGDQDLLGRPHMARAMVSKGYCRSIREAFDKYIGDQCPGYVPKPSLEVEAIIRIVKDAGGISSIAHPYKLFSNLYIEDFRNMGLNGLEVYYMDHTSQQVAFYESITRKFGLIRTGGSDFHGEDNRGTVFGSFTVPEVVLDDIGKYCK